MRPSNALALVAIAALACAPSRAPLAPVAPGPLRVDVRVERGGESLVVDERVPPGLDDELRVERETMPFVRDLEVLRDARWTPVETREGVGIVPGCARSGCALRYTFELGDAARALGDPDYAVASDGVLEAPPSSFVLRPRHVAPGARFVLRAREAPGARFATGFPRSREVPDAYEASVVDLANAPFTAFGDLRTTTIQAGGGAIEIAIGRGRASASDAAVLAWAKRAADAIVAYYGRFPMERALVVVLPNGGDRIGPGVTMGDGGTTILVGVGAGVSEEQLASDWILAHEMVHLALPTLDRRHHWLEEGVATYVEPIARAKTGTVRIDRVWQDMIEGLPNGLPAAGDRGLDETPTWGRTYWGGALFCLLADVEIRRATSNARSLEDALRAVIAAGGNGAVRWPIERVLETADRGAGVAVLRPLYERMAHAPAPIDLDALFRDLGVRLEGGRVVYEAHAPEARLREAIVN